MQLHVVQRQKVGDKKIYFILKESPGSRKCPVLGNKSQRDVLLCGFISENKLLLKMRTDRKTDTFWTLIDSSGEILDFPRTLSRILYSDDWTSMKTQLIKSNQNQLLLESQKKIVAFRFNENGILLDSVEFEAEHPQINLIANSFQGNYQGELFQVAIISEKQKKPKVLKEND